MVDDYSHPPIELIGTVSLGNDGERNYGEKAKHLRLYLFLSALAINLFMEVIIIANGFSIHYFFYATQMTVKIDLLPPLWTTLFWIGSLYVIYITRDIVKDAPSFRRINQLLNVALVGSFLLIISNIFAVLHALAESALIPSFHQFLFLTLTSGYILSFAGSSLVLLMIIAQSRIRMTLFLIYFFSLFVPIEVWSLVHWVAYPFDVIAYLKLAWQGAFVELQIFYIAYPLILGLFIAFLFSWVWMPLAKRLRNRIRMNKWIDLKRSLYGSSNSTALRNETSPKNTAGHKNPVGQNPSAGRLGPAAVLLTSLVLGVFIAYYPYISQKPGLVGTDSLGYYYTLTALDGKDIYQAALLAKEINSVRVLYHLTLYLLRNVSQLSPYVVVELMPIITIVANALAVFWFVKIGEKSVLMASTAAAFSTFSFTTTIAMHAGMLANWLDMALGFVMFGLLLGLQKKTRLKLLFVAILTAAVVFLVHYWSGLFFLLVLGCYLLTTLLEQRNLSFKLAVAAVLVTSAVLAALLLSDLALQLFAPYGISSGFEVTRPVEFAVAFWTRLPILIDTWFFGALANPIILALSLVGIALCFHQRTSFNRLLISWTIVGALLSVLVSPIGKDMDQWLLWRTLYLIPFQVLATIGFFFFVAKLGELRTTEGVAQLNHGVTHCNKYSFSFLDERSFAVLALLIGYASTAFLLTLNFPVVPTLLLFNYPIITLVAHFKMRKRAGNTVLVFVFVLLVTLMLFNYVLRSLAPLAVHRLQP